MGLHCLHVPFLIAALVWGTFRIFTVLFHLLGAGIQG